MSGTEGYLNIISKKLVIFILSEIKCAKKKKITKIYFCLIYYRGDALATLFSALYGKILVVMGIAFPMAEVISTYIPPSFYEVS